ncbi:MAG: hypothetical protein QM715_00815 [Nibricoccus sp.]
MATMHEGGSELFLDRNKIDSFRETTRVLSEFYELKKSRFNSVIESQVALRDIHRRQNDEIGTRYYASCKDYLKELFRSCLAELLQAGKPLDALYSSYLTWFGHWINALKAQLEEKYGNQHGSDDTNKSRPSSHRLKITAAENALTPPLASAKAPPGAQACIDCFCKSVKDHLGTDALHIAGEVMVSTPIKSIGKFRDWLEQSPVELTPLRETSLVFHAKFIERSAAGSRIEYKIYTAMNRISQPLAPHLKRIIAERDLTIHNWMLAQMLSRWRADYFPQLVPPETIHSPPDYDYQSAFSILQSYFQTEPHHWPTFAQGVVELVERPRTFLRWNCGPEHHPIKRQLRNFIELVTGPIANPVERNDLLTRLKSPGATREEILILTSEYLALLSDQKPTPAQIRRELDPIVSGWTDNLPLWLPSLRVAEQKFRLRRADDVELEKLMAEETAAEEEAEQLRATWSNFHMEHSDGVEPAFLDETETIAITYVENLGAESWRTHAIRCPRHDFAIAFDLHLFDHDVETVVPVSSIARAIEHYLFEMTTEQQNMVPMERIAGEPWRKLKRGGQRIYILEKNGEIFVHLMKRKDWAFASVQEARY